jgi:protein-S-isoprenylcysteine O-methyltransferase Ste14
MPWNDSVKSILSTVLLALILPIPVYLLWMHGLQNLWRRLGPASYLLHLALYATMVYVLVRMHRVWSRGAWPWPDAIAWLALVPLAIAAWLIVESYRTIDWRTLHQVRQFAPGAGRELVRSGILGRMRHPRYLAFSLVAIGNALLTGYPLVAAAAVVTIALLAVVIALEERELRDFFGEEFERYRREVPAFIPRPSGGRPPSDAH